MIMSENMNQVLVPHSLYIRLEKCLKNSPFFSVDEYVISILKEHLAQIEKSEKSKSDDEKLVMERLKKLGYIN